MSEQQLREPAADLRTNSKNFRQAGHGNGVTPLGVGLHRRRRIHRQLIEPRRQFQLRVDRLVPSNLPARFDRHAAENAGHGRLGAPLGFVVGLVLADGVEQQVVFALVVIAAGPL